MKKEEQYSVERVFQPEGKTLEALFVEILQEQINSSQILD